MMRFLLLIVLLTAGSLAVDRSVVRRAILEKRSVRRLDSGAFWYEKSSSLSRGKRQANRNYPAFADDEDFEASSVESSGDFPAPETNDAGSDDFAPRPQDFGWQRAKINLLDSVAYNRDLEDHNSDYFGEIAYQIMNSMESYVKLQLGGYSEATPIMFRVEDGDVMATVDIGMCGSTDPAYLEPVIYRLVRQGILGNFQTSTKGFEMRNLGLDPNRPECMASGPLPTTSKLATTSKATTRSTTTTSRTTTTTQRTTTTTRFYPSNLVDDDEEIEDEETSTEVITERPSPQPISTTYKLTTPNLPDFAKPCRTDEATCSNFECIDRSKICDGVEDCSDGSDEPMTCNGSHRQCAPEEFLCEGTGECKQKIWWCDGDTDCLNGFDEQSCPSAQPGSSCKATEFQCVTDGKCIPKSYLCDSESDCNDGSDEDGCSIPRVTRPPIRFVNATEGETVVLECQSVGFPTPVITWRMNWDNVAPPPRVTMTSVNGFGTLTIRNVQMSDMGAYSCEAMNVLKTILAQPDAIVNVMPSPPTPEPKRACPTGQFLTTNYAGKEVCKPCYCSGVTDKCQGTVDHGPVRTQQVDFNNPDDDEAFLDLQPIDFGDNENPRSPVNRAQIVVNPETNELQLIDLSKRFLAAAHYWSLPAQFLGAKIESYGGTLKYSFSYNNSGHESPEPIDATDVVLEGRNSNKLYYKGNDGHPAPGKQHNVAVVLEEEFWETDKGAQATRKDLMDVLSTLNRVLIRTIYDGNMLSTGIGKIKMNSEGEESGGRHAAAQSGGQRTRTIEVCECPPQYTGTSCEMCSEGYVHNSDQICVEEEEAPEDTDEASEDNEATLDLVTTTAFIPTFPPGELRGECEEGYTGADCSECDEGYELLDEVCTKLPLVACNSIGTSIINVDNTCTCKSGCEGENCDRCKPGYFYLAPENTEGCIECYCSGVSSICGSSSLYRTHVQPVYTDPEAFVITVVGRDSTEEDLSGRVVTIKQSQGNSDAQASVTVELDDIGPSGLHYWSLRGDFVGNKLTSYGGNFDYSISFHKWRDGGDRQSSNQPITDRDNLLLEGGGITLHHVDDKELQMDVTNRYTVKLREEYWLTDYGLTPTRSQFMQVLTNVERFLVRASYLNGPTSSTLTDVYLETAVDERTGRSQALEVEQCTCPPGYTGLSCEQCSDGYIGQLYQGITLCKKAEDEIPAPVVCDCNGHSECDPFTGECLHCRGNTAGEHCERCVDGYYLDMDRGVCTMCPCGQEGITCSLDNFNNPLCDECLEGYAGPQCNLCAEGYEIDLTIQDEIVCITEKQQNCNCDKDGSIGNECDENGQCQCHDDYDGKTCSNCKKGRFSYNIENPDGHGCIPCFCMGITKDCEQTSLKRVQIVADFQRRNFFTLGDINKEFVSSNEILVLEGGDELLYRELDTISKKHDPFWQFDEEFLGEKVISYGGKLEFELTNLPRDVMSRRRFRPKILIRGNNVTLQAVKIKKEEGGLDVNPGSQRYVTKFTEKSWQHYYDQTPATREDILMALADLDMLLVQARFSKSQSSTGLKNVIMETAKEDDLRLDVAFAVEDCNCPDGYKGFSCEDCAPGYTRNVTDKGFYLGFCEKCDCNGHSQECDSTSGTCLNCAGHTTGAKCENCAPGYFRYPGEDSTNPCRPCLCPPLGGRNCSNPVAVSCSVDEVGDVKCDQCNVGYAGKKCDICADGYESNPRISRGECVEITALQPGEAPSVEVKPKNVIVEQGDNIMLTCDVVSGEDVEIQWRRTKVTGQYERLPALARTMEGGRKLEIRRFRFEDTGDYHCVATNQYGSNQDSARVLPDGNQSIRVSIPGRNQKYVSIGGSVEFMCEARSTTENYKLVWMRPGTSLPPQATQEDGRLRIPNVQIGDHGLYLCVGTNVYGGRSRAAAHLVMNGKG